MMLGFKGLKTSVWSYGLHIRYLSTSRSMVQLDLFPGVVLLNSPILYLFVGCDINLQS